MWPVFLLPARLRKTLADTALDSRVHSPQTLKEEQGSRDLELRIGAHPPKCFPRPREDHPLKRLGLGNVTSLLTCPRDPTEPRK